MKKNGDGQLHDPEFHGKVLEGQHAFAELPWRGKDYRFEQEIDTTELAFRTLIVLHGLVGTGKTSVANTIASQLACHPLHTDEFWFKLGLRDREVDPGVSADHYDLMHDLCWSVIGSGRDVVLDCTSRWRTFRRRLIDSFAPWGVLLVFVSCSCSEASVLQRIAQRKQFGPHDMGNETEYRRVQRDYKPITPEEARQINLIRVDTDELTCTESLIDERDADRVRRVREAIEKGYLQKLRPIVR
jgi:predicted kinase